MQLSAPRLVPPLEKLEFASDNPIQLENNKAIAERIEKGDAEARERVEDAIKFATWMKPNQPEVEIFVSSAPIISLKGEENGNTFHIHLCHGHFGYSVNNSTKKTISNPQERISVGFKLYRAWETLIKHLPEGFVIYGPDADPQGEDFQNRESILTGLGFGATEPNGDRFGIVRGGKVTPLTGVEFAALTDERGVASLFNQRLMVEEILWNTEE